MNMALKRQFAQQYANTHVETSVSEASPHKLVEMLYEGVLKNITLAKVFMEQRDYEKKSLHINKALSILIFMRESVDLDKGGDVADNLYALYDYCHRTVLNASVKNDIELLDEIAEYIRGLHDAWKQMPDQYKQMSKEQLDSAAR